MPIVCVELSCGLTSDHLLGPFRSTVDRLPRMCPGLMSDVAGDSGPSRPLVEAHDVAGATAVGLPMHHSSGPQNRLLRIALSIGHQSPPSATSDRRQSPQIQVERTSKLGTTFCEPQWAHRV